jgi:hypothetical protein
MQLSVSRAAFEILVHSRGEIYHLRDDYDGWMSAFKEITESTIEQIAFIRPAHMCDIGSSLGAVDVVMAKVYETHCTLIDGEDGKGKPDKHAKPWASRIAVQEFWDDNGVGRDRYLYRNPKQIGVADPIYDLVISTRSWCFHYPPEEYLNYVQQHTVMDSGILVDIRRDKPEWRKQMALCFDEYVVLEYNEKYERVLFKVRGKRQ